MDSVTDGAPHEPGEAWARYRVLLEEAQQVREHGRRMRARRAAAEAARSGLGGQTSWTL